MPLRRPSASASQGSQNTFNHAPLRVHKTTDSHHGLASVVGVSTLQQHSVLSLGASATPQQKIVQVLVNRLKNKLPCNSGLLLDRLEADIATQKAIEALVDLSHDSLDMIAWALSELLERLAKQTDNTGYLTLDVLQSQLFILKVLSMTMASRWTHSPRSNSRTSNNPATSTPDSPVMPGSSSRRTRRAPSEHSSLLPTLSEPPAMEDACAKYILSVMVVFLRQTASSEIPLIQQAQSTDITFRDFDMNNVSLLSDDTASISSDARNTPEPGLHNQPSSSSLKSGRLSINSTAHIPATNTTYEKTHMSLLKSNKAVNKLIAKYAARIIFHISASNWNVVFSRLRNKIHFLANNNQENPDIVDLQLMAHSALDRQRLVQVLNELSSLVVNMDAESQLSVAIQLRAAVWNWIDLFPAEFNDAIRTRGRTEGAPERVFDLLYTNIQKEKENIFWPTLMILNCITSDRISPDFDTYTRSQKTNRRDIKFLEEVFRHTNTTSKLSQVALACAIDACRAAIFISPDGEVPLRMITYDIAHDIKGYFTTNTHASRKPFWDSHEAIDIGLYAEALVAIYRFLPAEHSLPVFANCLDPERSEAVKTCAIRASLTLIQEGNRFSWQRPLDDLQDVVAYRIREILKMLGSQSAEVDQLSNAKKSAMYPRSKQQDSETLSDSEILILGILSLWRANPLFFMKGVREDETKDWIEIASNLWELPYDMVVKVSMATCLRSVSEVAYNTPSTEVADLGVTSFVIQQAMPITLLSVAANLLRAREDTEAQRLWMAISHQTIEMYVRKSKLEHVRVMQLSVERLPAFAITEIAFLVSLTSSDNSVSQLAAKGLRLLAHAERAPGAPVSSHMTDEERSKRNPIYEQLGDSKLMIGGRLGHQKRIRKLVRMLTFFSGVQVAVWLECHARWCYIFGLLRDGFQLSDGAPASAQQQELRFQWQNLTLFLAALAGSSFQENLDLNILKNAIPLKYLPDQIRVTQTARSLIESFVAHLTGLLVHIDLPMREVARDALGTELSPRLYGKLLKHLDATMRNLEQVAGSELTDSYLLFLDQLIAVLKLLAENAHSAVEDVMSIDISSIMLSIANFVNRYVGPATLRVKIKYCVLCDACLERTDSLLCLRKETGARHIILDRILGWITNYDRREESALVISELNIAILRTAVKLLDRLELKPTDDTNTGDDVVHVVSRLFNKYSSTLLHCLDACHEVGADSNSDSGSAQQKYKISQRGAELRELVITGLSHLVASNSESGFKACLPLAYDRDNRKRAIFAHVFARVISEGTKFDPEDRSAAEMRHTRLCELVRGSDMVLAITICEICPPSEADMMISVLMNVFNTRASLTSLLKIMIDREISLTDNEAGLFRGNSTCTRFLSAFARIHGYTYLRALVQPLIKIIEELPSGSAFDVDPSRVSEEVAKQNQQTVEFVAAKFLTIVSSSIQSVPPMFREVCAHIAQSVVAIWPESKFPAIGAFVFLRFISPAVVSPETIDVEIPKGAGSITLRKGLMVTAKILQNLANNIFFGKEAHMTVYNTFLHSNIASVTRFLSDLQKPNNSADDDDDQWLGITSDDSDMIVLHRFFDKHADKIGKELLSLSKPNSEGDSSAICGKRAWDGLCALLVDLGSPLEAPRISQLDSHDHEEYNDLMDRCADREIESVEDLFVQTGAPPDTRSIFVLRLSKIDVEALDIELLMYHIFKTIALTDGTFEIILDCTSFTSISEVPLQWLKYCAELIPADIRSRFSATRILNPNTLAQRYLRRLYNVSAGYSICGEIRAYNSVAHLSEHIPQECLEQLNFAVSLEEEAKATFQDVKMKVPHLRLPIILDVGTSHLRITSVKTQLISSGLSCKSSEIIPLSDISDVYNVAATGHELYEFIIRQRQGHTIYLSSPSRESIVKTIRATKAQIKEVQTAMTERFSRFSNVPATLLHIGLLSVDPNDEELRGAAYELLGAVCVYLKFDKSPIIAFNAGFLPGDPNSFVVQLSEKLAGFAPQLTLDFIHEVSAAMTTMGEGAGVVHRIGCLQYLRPWIHNLSHYSNPASPLFERSGARLRDCIRTLSELSMQYPEITSSIQHYVWTEVGKLDSVTLDVILDDLARTAADGGIGNRRCEAVAQILGSMLSINVRGRIYSKLRKALGKQSPKPVFSLAEFPNWPEISSLIRLAHVAGTPSQVSSNNQLYVPEIVHLVTIVAGEGSLLVRKSVYGIVMNLMQSLYITRTDDLSDSRTDDSSTAELLQLINDCTQSATLKLFGLSRDTPTSEYAIQDPINDKENLDNQEQLTMLLMRTIVLSAGSNGLLNVWKTRWASLAASTAFQLSPAVQTRAFTTLGCLAVSDVDDDLVYQILVAFQVALKNADEHRTISVVSMLRCMCKIVPAIEATSKYMCLFFWLAISLLQASHPAFYVEATWLLRVTLEIMEQQGMFNDSVADVLLEGRDTLEEVTSQLDELLGLSFESSFSFSLASILFKGIRLSALKDSAESVLRSLLAVTVKAHEPNATISNGFKDSVYPDALGYFLALIPVSTSPAAYRRLLHACNIDEAWFPDAGLPDLEEDDNCIPRISPAFLGINDSRTALLATTFIGTMLSTAQGDDAETEILYYLLSELSSTYPEIVSMAYESIQDKIKDTFANASKPSIIRSVSNIFRVALQDTPRFVGTRIPGASSSTINSNEENMFAVTQHKLALDELRMSGLANTLQFLPANRGHATKMINWIPQLVALMIM